MRYLVLLLAITLTSCAASAIEAPIFIEDFIGRSIPIECELIPDLGIRDGGVRDLVTVDDTTLLALFEGQGDEGEIGEVVIIGPELEVRHSISFDAGPEIGVRMPSSAITLADSLIYIADQATMGLKILDLQGVERGVVRLDFSPGGIRATGDTLLITPFVVGGHPQSLLHTLYKGDVRALPAPTSRYRDALTTTLANTANVAAFNDGRIVLTQMMVVPYAYHFYPGNALPERVPLPLPDGVSERYGWLPTSTLTEDDAESLLFSALASAPDLSTGDLIYLTKTERKIESGSEKALIRADSDLHYLRSYLLDVNANRMAYLAVRESAITTTPEGEWYSCKIP